jgi:nucleotidyltransferase substrate binding protein (TIGR01987 family)
MLASLCTVYAIIILTITGKGFAMEFELDITALQNAVQALEDSIETYKKYSGTDIKLTDSLRSGVIQNFETAYELCWKYMKRWLEGNISPDIVAGAVRKEFYRIANENLLISDPEAWFGFHSARNKTSHVYNKIAAEEVLKAAFKFLPYAKELISKLEA